MDATEEIFAKSTATLKKAVPLMMKYQVPTTPTNYALWYAYASNEVPKLNEELEMLLENFNVLPSSRV